MINQKYLFFDIDGTIAENDEAPSELTKCALQQLRLRGHRTFLCTGRTLCDIYPAITSIGFDGIISGAGANVMVDGNMLFHSVLPRALLTETVRRMWDCNISGVLEGTEQMYLVEGAVPLNWPIFMPHINCMEQLCIVEKVEKLTFHVTNAGQVQPLETFLNQHYDLYPNSDGTFFELVLKGCNKGTSVTRVLDYYHALPQDAFAFGDSLNDYSMFRNVKTAIAMGNAPQVLLDASSMVTATIRQEGVYRALAELNLIEEIATHEQR